MDEITSEYKIDFSFRFSDGQRKDVNIRIDEKTLNIIRPEIKVPPSWAKLENFKCIHCPLDELKFKYCPVAVNLNDIIIDFHDFNSYDKVEVFINTEAREYYKNTSLQNGLGSMLGVIMVANDCPIMGRLKPMMRYHLPFATLDETDYRVMAMYMLAQYVIAKKGGQPDWEMNKLKEVYEDIKILNQNVSRQLSKILSKDAVVNAVVVLNSFAEHVTFLLSKNMMKRLEILFKDYL